MFESLWQSVTVRTRTQSGSDAFYRPVYTYNEQILNNVLIKPEDGVNVEQTSTRQEGHDIKYSLYIPKSYSNLDFENASVKINNEWLEVIGAPKAYPACPTDYSCVVKVGVKHG